MQLRKIEKSQSSNVISIETKGKRQKTIINDQFRLTSLLKQKQVYLITLKIHLNNTNSLLAIGRSDPFDYFLIA
jgi:hypothetical protein